MGKICRHCGHYRPDWEIDQDGFCRRTEECALRVQRRQRGREPVVVGSTKEDEE